MTSTPYRVRCLGPDDVPVLRAMLRVFGEAFEDPERYSAQPPDDAWLRTLLAQAGFFAFAALRGTEVVGGAAGYVLPKFERACHELYLYDLAVAAAHRRRGIATTLLAELRAFARRTGAEVVFVQADAADAPAVALYERFGTGTDVRQFDIEP